MQQYNLLALDAFRTVITAKSFSAAARQLGTSTATLSRRVSALECALGVKLLHRTTRKIDPTEAGKRYYQDVQEIFCALEEAEERVRQERQAIRGNLRVAAPSSFGVNCIAPIIPQFMKIYPHLTAHFHLEDKQTDLVSESIDVAIRVGFLKDSSLVATRIGAASNVFCASPQYLSQYGEPEQPADLVNHSCLHYSLISKKREWSFADQTIEITGPLSTNNGEVLKEAAIQGMGITMLPVFIVRDALLDKRLQVILPSCSPQQFGLYAIRLSRRFTPAKVMLFIDYLKEQFDGEQKLDF
ncbi:Transcriptional regulator, LysR family [hydrothermal vent metagenome]|uniref:Transcriptional regulator, LysR family n=1 Tax=hydrothermal vent metagenome TaxID=652676 RepID=A0A3B0TTF8_9ZZZZ